MGDNIRDAALTGFAPNRASSGWFALTEQARERGVLAADYGSTCLRLSGGKLLIDRTSGFSEDEFFRTNREYQKFGIKAFWVISVSEKLTPGFATRFGDRCLRMAHFKRATSHFKFDGVAHTLEGGLNYVLNGATDESTVIPLHRRKGKARTLIATAAAAPI